MQNLNSLNALLEHAHKTIKHVKIQCIYELLEHDADYSFKEEIPFKSKMRFAFLALIHRVHVLAAFRSLKNNHTALHRNPQEILAKCKKALDKDLLGQLERVLNNNNPTKFVGHTTAAQREEIRACLNCSSINKNLKKVEKTSIGCGKIIRQISEGTAYYSKQRIC